MAKKIQVDFFLRWLATAVLTNWTLRLRHSHHADKIILFSSVLSEFFSKVCTIPTEYVPLTLIQTFWIRNFLREILLCHTKVYSALVCAPLFSSLLLYFSLLMISLSLSLSLSLSAFYLREYKLSIENSDSAILISYDFSLLSLNNY